MNRHIIEYENKQELSNKNFGRIYEKCTDDKSSGEAVVRLKRRD